MATTSVVALFTRAVRVAATPPASPSASSLAIASQVTSSCSLSGTTCNLGAAAERIAGVLADRGIDVSGRTILRWVQKFGPALAQEVRRHCKPAGTTWLVDETYVKIRGIWNYVYRGIDSDGQVLDCWLSRTRDLAAAEAFFRRTIGSTECTPEHVVTDKATFYPSAGMGQMPRTRRPVSTTG